MLHKCHDPCNLSMIYEGNLSPCARSKGETFRMFYLCPKSCPRRITESCCYQSCECESANFCFSLTELYNSVIIERPLASGSEPDSSRRSQLHTHLTVERAPLRVTCSQPTDRPPEPPRNPSLNTIRKDARSQRKTRYRASPAAPGETEVAV